MHAKMVELRDVVNGDYILPLAEIDQAEQPAVANLALQAIEQKAGRIASTMPTVKFPAVRAGFKGSEEKARMRGQVIDAWYQQNEMGLKMQRRAKHAIAYAMSPVLIRPHGKKGCPWWEVSDPITTFAPEMDTGELNPPNVMFSYLKSAAWVRQTFPAQYGLINKGKGGSDKPIRILEWCDDKELVLVAIGESNQQPGMVSQWGDTPAGSLVELQRIPNLIGRCMAVVPGRLGVDRIQGELEGIIGMYQMQAKVMALEVIGIQRDIWAETWLVGAAGQNPVIEEMADPLRGIVGKVRDGQIIHQQRPASQSAFQMLDRLERGIRVEASIPSELGGESSTNIRTGKRGDAVLSAAIDFPIQMIHKLFEASLRVENEIAIAIDKAYFPTSKSFFISATAGELRYTPSDLWETDTNFVQYSQAGVDIQGLVVAAGQRIGIGAMSKQTFMEIDPLVDDPEAEKDRITTEALQTAFLQSVQTRASQDPSFVKPLATMMIDIKTNKLELAEAYLKADAALQAQQLQQQQGQAPPEAAMPGMTAPEAVPPPPASAQNLSDLLRTVRQRGDQPVKL